LLLALAGGTLYRASDQRVFSVGSGVAFEPWQTWHPDGSATAEALIGAAILVSNGHNVQPWRFRVGQDHMDLLGDDSRRTGAMDPVDRELWIGLGCALENLVLAARAAGYAGDAALFPDLADPWLAAGLSLAPGATTRSELPNSSTCGWSFQATCPQPCSGAAVHGGDATTSETTHAPAGSAVSGSHWAGGSVASHGLAATRTSVASVAPVWSCSRSPPPPEPDQVARDGTLAAGRATLQSR